MKKGTLKSFGARLRFGRNSLPDSHLRQSICDACGTHNIMPVNDHTRYMTCMGCGRWIILASGKGEMP